MKIAILKNKGTDEEYLKQEIEKLKYFNNINKNFGLNNIPYTYDIIDVDFEVNLYKKGTNASGLAGYTLKNTPNIPLGYDFVCIFYDGKSIYKDGTNLALTRSKPVNGAFISEIPDSAKENTLIHEIMHMICKKLKSLGYPVIDQMDRTKVNGRYISYYKDNTPTANLGNYHVTLLSIDKYTKFLSSKTNPLGLPDAVWKLILSFVEANKKKPKYKNFSELEVKGLNHDFVLLLDKARDIAGIPFIINSGFRTPEHNKAVGGVDDSAHLSGLAVDLRARNGAETYAIVKAAIEVGIKRIGINRASQFVHLDIAEDKPNPTIYEY